MVFVRKFLFVAAAAILLCAFEASGYENCLLDSECRREVCMRWTDVCGEGGECHSDVDNGYPYYKCTCKPGYVNVTPDVCVHSSIASKPVSDMSMGDSCLDASECDPNADCTLVGGAIYKCRCNDGYVGNGKTCSSNGGGNKVSASASSSGTGAAGSGISCPSNFCSGIGATCLYEPESNKAYCVCSDGGHVGATQDCE